MSFQTSMMDPGRVVFSVDYRVTSGQGGLDLLRVSVLLRKAQILFIGFGRVPWQNFRRLRLDCVLRAHDMRQHFVLNQDRARGVLGQFRSGGRHGRDGRAGETKLSESRLNNRFDSGHGRSLA